MEIRISNGRTIRAEAYKSIYQTLKEEGIYLVASCGGKGVCGKCRVRILEGEARIESRAKLKKKELEQKYALACAAYPESDLLIEIPEDSRLVIGDRIAGSKTAAYLERIKNEGGLSPAVLRLPLEIPPPTIEDHVSDLERLRRALSLAGIDGMKFSHRFISRIQEALRASDWKINLAYTKDNEAVSIMPPDHTRSFGLAVDIGTTTVVVYLVDCMDGRLVDSGMTYNSQMRHGDDVITRIIYAVEGGGLNDLRSAVANDINDIIQPILERNGLKNDEVESMVVAGNTVMSHLFWGLDPSSIREEPYIPTLNSFPYWKASTAKIKINSNAPVYTLPCVGSYVGGDIVAGVLASGMHRKPEIALFMDIGTNGEIAVGNEEWLITAACSAGPCFEGSGIRNGMRATEGAIESVKIDRETFEPTIGVIGDTAPTGICGSGMIDAISELFFAGVIDGKGKFIRELATDRIRFEEEGPEYVLYRSKDKDVVLTEVDIENIMRAKAAIYAGVSLLLREVGLSLDVIERIYIAGGFGNYLNVEKAVMLGMLPDLPREKFSFIGNTSIAGAYMCLLSENMRSEAEDVARRMTYMELSVSHGFMDEYMAALFLPHTDPMLFPSVSARLGR